MNLMVRVGLVEGAPHVDVVLHGRFRATDGRVFESGSHRFTGPVELSSLPGEVPDFSTQMVIGRSFHWERAEPQRFSGQLRIVGSSGAAGGLTLINDVPIESYVTSVISSEMSASCPLELLKAHAVISRSWLAYPHADGVAKGMDHAERVQGDEVLRWYGRTAHQQFDVCPDDHCQRYQGLTKAFSPSAAESVRLTAGEVLLFDNTICDARFSKCCGGITEAYSSAWEDRAVPYLVPVRDGEGPVIPAGDAWILSSPPAYCNATDPDLIATILPGFDQETPDFFRWSVRYEQEELSELFRSKTGIAIGEIRELVPVERGVSGRLIRLRVVGSQGTVTIGKELEIRRALSRSHLYSSAFVAQREGNAFVLRGAGWGHGVGLCQIGAAVLASQGWTYRDILSHYYPGTTIGAQFEMS